MSLYYEAADVLENSDKIGGSLKSRLYKKKDLKSSTAQIFALITETSKWSTVLKDIIEKSELLAVERKLSPVLALLLSHDLLVSKRGVAAPANHVLKLAITRHKARLSAELTKARLRSGHATLEAFKQALSDEAEGIIRDTPRHPRWVRVNTLKSTLSQQLASTFAGYTQADSLETVMSAVASSKTYFTDPNIPNLLALPPKIDLSRTKAYSEGQIIFQDKASCFPAYLLDIQPDDGDVIDGCAAPGNKTTHLAAIVRERSLGADQSEGTQKVFAFERDRLRTKTLDKMVKLAGADGIVRTKGEHDFLTARPQAEEFTNVGAILLDPSCSGTGIVGRDDAIELHLPEIHATTRSSTAGKKRKRGGKGTESAQATSTLRLDVDETQAEETPAADDGLAERLTALATFQLRILTHAMSFSNARKITYSTCSIHFEENEGVVFRALATSIAREKGWRILKRNEQVSGMKSWHRRGVIEADKLDQQLVPDGAEQKDILDACIRCDKGTAAGTMGFFVAAFVRDVESCGGSTVMHDIVPDQVGSEDEWNGFSDDDTTPNTTMHPHDEAQNTQKKKKKSKKRRSATA